jgi:hypothetical protein
LGKYVEAAEAFIWFDCCLLVEKPAAAWKKIGEEYLLTGSFDVLF